MGQESSKWTDKAIVILTGGIVLAAAVQTVIFKKQWKEMSDAGKQTDQMLGLVKKQVENMSQQARDTHELALQAKNQADNTAEFAKAAIDQAKKLEAGVVETHALASAAKMQADTAAAANKIALDATTVDERAWVSVDVGEKTGNFSVTMRNTGKTPAINVTEVTAFAGGKRMGPPEVDFSKDSSSAIMLPKNAPPEFLEQLKKEGFIRDRPPSGYVIAPGDTQIASDYQGQFTQIFRIEGNRIYVQGRVTYDDIFGKSHETLFCYWFAPPSDFVMCNDHNKMN